MAKAEAAEANERQQEQQHALNRFVRGSRVQRLGKQARHGCRNPAFNCGKMRVIRLGSPAVEDMLRSASPPGRWSSALQESGRQIVQQKIVPEHLVQQQIYAPHATARIGNPLVGRSTWTQIMLALFYPRIFASAPFFPSIVILSC